MRPFLRFENVTCRLVGFSILFISSLTRPILINDLLYYVLSVKYVVACTHAKKGNEAVLRAGAADIKANIKKQESQRAIMRTMGAQVLEYRRQINDLNTMLSSRPHAANRLDVLDAINDKNVKNQIIKDVILNISKDK